MNDQQRKSAVRRTIQALLVAWLAFLLGGYATRFSWNNWGWAATAIAGAGLAGILFVLVRDFWRSDA